MTNKIYFSHKILFSKKKYFYPLLKNGLNSDDLSKGVQVLKSGRITMGKKTLLFERKFAKKLGTKFAVMVNSGSSANLLATFASTNPLRKNVFKKGDYAIIQSLCWSTSLWPLIQAGLKIKFVDIDPNTLNVNAEDLISKINKKTKLVMLVNVLGLSSDIFKIRKYCKRKKIILIEDNCESLGSKYKNKYMGSFGDFGTFSFFYSHQITSGEGGMVVCNDKNDYKILKSLRSHGWSRDYDDAKKYPNLDPRYIFLNSGFNLRPMDIQAAIADSQFEKLKTFKTNRINNRNKIINILISDKRWNNQFHFIETPKEIEPSFMVFPILLDERYKNKKIKFINYIESKGLETRPIISGSFTNQPSTKLYKLNKNNTKFKGAEKIQSLGFVIGLYTQAITKRELIFIKDTLFSIDKI